VELFINLLPWREEIKRRGNSSSPYPLPSRERDLGKPYRRLAMERPEAEQNPQVKVWTPTIDLPGENTL